MPLQLCCRQMTVQGREGGTHIMKSTLLSHPSSPALSFCGSSEAGGAAILCCLGKAIWGVQKLRLTYLMALQPLPRTCKPAVSETSASRVRWFWCCGESSPLLLFSLHNRSWSTSLVWGTVVAAQSEIRYAICCCCRGCVSNELMYQPRVHKLTTRRPQHSVQKQQHSAGSSTQNNQSPRCRTCLQLPGCVDYLLHRCLHLLQGRL